MMSNLKSGRFLSIITIATLVCSVDLGECFSASDHEIEYSQNLYKETVANEKDENFIIFPMAYYAFFVMLTQLPEQWTERFDDSRFKEVLEYKKEYPREFELFEIYGKKQNIQDLFKETFVIDAYAYIPPSTLLKIELKKNMEKKDFIPKIFYVDKQENGSVKIKNWFRPDGYELNEIALNSIKTEIAALKDESMKIFLAKKFFTKFVNSFSDAGTRNFITSSHEVKQVSVISSTAEYVIGNLSDISAKFIVLPLSKENMEMIIFVPDEVQGLQDIEENISTFKKSYLLSHSQNNTVNVVLPKFKTSTLVDVTKFFEKGNAIEILTQFVATNDYITLDSSELLKVMRCLWYGIDVIDVDADSATGDSKSDSGSEFVIDKPFYYQIKLWDYVFLEGRVVDPTL